MAGTKAGGKKMSETIKSKYGLDFWQKVGARGGRKGTTGGFASNKVGADGLTGKQRASLVGQKGGRKSSRGKAIK